MKQNVLFYILFFLLSALGGMLPSVSSAQVAEPANEDREGIRKFYYPGGELFGEGRLKDGEPDGYWKYYFENGQLKSEGKLVNRQKEGTWFFYHKNGQVEYENFYQNGLREGPQCNYNKSGTLLSMQYYADDKFVRRDENSSFERIAKPILNVASFLICFLP